MKKLSILEWVSLGVAFCFIGGGVYCVVWPQAMTVSHADNESLGAWHQWMSRGEVRGYGVGCVVVGLVMAIGATLPWRSRGSR